MIRFTSTLLLAILVTAHISCGTNKEINSLAKKAREPNQQSFVAYTNGDTIKGTTLKRRSNPLNNNEKWLMDGKQIPSANVKSFQDANGFREGGQDGHTRLIRSKKMNLYLAQTKSRSYKHGNSINPGGYQTDYSTSFLIGYKGGMQQGTYGLLKYMMRNCPEALKQIDVEFGEFKDAPSVKIKDYRALVRLINIFNACEESEDE